MNYNIFFYQYIYQTPCLVFSSLRSSFLVNGQWEWSRIKVIPVLLSLSTRGDFSRLVPIAVLTCDKSIPFIIYLANVSDDTVQGYRYRTLSCNARCYFGNVDIMAWEWRENALAVPLASMYVNRFRWLCESTSCVGRNEFSWLFIIYLIIDRELFYAIRVSEY